YKGKTAGTFGDVGCFSFYANKNIACGEGGMLVTNRDDLAERVRLMRSHGMTTLSFDRARGHATDYDVVLRGFNFRMDDIRAALVLAQLGKLEADTAARARLRQLYVEQLRDISELIIPYADCPHQSSHYIMPVVLKQGGAARRNAIRHALAQRGIQTSVHYPAVHQFSIYRSLNAQLPNTEFVSAHEITLPLHSKMDESTVSLVVKALRECLAR
ncbi:MAG: DegT/DnrJ/EryC1/StrS family aminotransferase, partial [Verrucomicrobiae bacterium]|nr:DegT/DnrJ/EryC1/StrS family aminotransferase [Verrucomicrobiae bacterium]